MHQGSLYLLLLLLFTMEDKYKVRMRSKANRGNK